MYNLEGKVAVITGGARGQGAAHGRMMARAGAKVVITDILDEEGMITASEIGSQVNYIHHDVTSETDWQRMVAEVETRHGRLDILVNNAGVWKPLAIAETTVEDYQMLVRINQLGTFLGMRAAVAPMRRSGGGSIVNISSMAALISLASSLAYSATKWAVRGMTKVAAIELAAARIRVNSVHPGAINTAMQRENSEEVNRWLPTVIPWGRLGEPEQIARLVCFLASDAADYITGAEVAIDGGWTA